jgi:mRNA interferase HicA
MPGRFAVAEERSPVARPRRRDFRHSRSHTIYLNRAAKKTTSVSRHNEINNDLARTICKDLQVPQPDV